MQLQRRNLESLEGEGLRQPGIRRCSHQSSQGLQDRRQHGSAGLLSDSLEQALMGSHRHVAQHCRQRREPPAARLLAVSKQVAGLSIQNLGRCPRAKWRSVLQAAMPTGNDLRHGALLLAMLLATAVYLLHPSFLLLQEATPSWLWTSQFQNFRLD